VVDVRDDAEVPDVSELGHRAPIVRAAGAATPSVVPGAAGTLDRSWRTSSPRSSGTVRTRSGASATKAAGHR
jgi:hypothetical protein